jgi:hypothetical protein
MEQKTAIPGFYKVDESVVINKDNDALKAYKARKEKERMIKDVQVEVQNLKSDINEIKQMLRGLVK